MKNLIITWFNCFTNFTLSSADKVTTGTYSFTSFIFKVAPFALIALASVPIAAVVNTQFSIHINESSILQLINGISNDLQKLLKYFSGTAIFIPFFVPFASVLVIRLALYLNEGALSSLVTSALLNILSLSKPHKLPELSE